MRVSGNADASKLLAVLMMFSLLTNIEGCKKSAPETSSSGTNQPAATETNQTAAPGAIPAFSASQLDELLAPIALYPDPLLMQILVSSTNPQGVLDAGNWLLQNNSLKGDQLDDAATKAGFSPSVQALVHFPTVVDMMCMEMDWTTQLGEAFGSRQKDVLDSIQRLRKQALNARTLQSTPQQSVKTKQEDGNQVVVIQPANPQVIYVPQYNPQVVYAPPPQPAPAPAQNQTGTKSSGVSTETAVLGALVTFGLGIAVGSALSNNNRYYYPAWGSGTVYYHNAIYRPVYIVNPGYRPGYPYPVPYRQPANYPYAYNKNNIYVQNNTNYFNRFQNNNNLNTRPVPTPYSGTSAQTRNPNPAAGNINPGGNQSNSWKGQKSYAGANGSARPASNAGTPATPGNMNRAAPGANASVQRPGTQQTRPAGQAALADNSRTTARGPATPSNLNRAAPGENANARRPSTQQMRPAGQAVLADNSRTSIPGVRTNNAKTPAPSTRPANANTPPAGDRGYAAGNRQAAPATRGGSSDAFAGAGNGRTERAASERGRASVNQSRSGGRRR